jgi:ribosomal protein S27E
MKIQDGRDCNGSSIITEYLVRCPVCRNTSTVHHNAWAIVVCLAADCDAHVINPCPDKDNELSRVERAETELHNAHLTIARTKRILGAMTKPSNAGRIEK